VGVTLTPGFLLELSVEVFGAVSTGVTETVVTSLTSVIWLDANDVVVVVVDETVEVLVLDVLLLIGTLCDSVESASVVDETPDEVT
jgi:hypothetical protein